MDPESIYKLGEITIKITGPLTLFMIAIIHLSVYARTRRFPSPRTAIYEYARINIAQRNHAGILTYMLVVGILFFLAGAAALIYAKIAGG